MMYLPPPAYINSVSNNNNNNNVQFGCNPPNTMNTIYPNPSTSSMCNGSNTNNNIKNKPSYPDETTPARLSESSCPDFMHPCSFPANFSNSPNQPPLFIENQPFPNIQQFDSPMTTHNMY